MPPPAAHRFVDAAPLLSTLARRSVLGWRWRRASACCPALGRSCWWSGWRGHRATGRSWPLTVTLVPVLLGLVVAVALRCCFALQESLSATASLRIRQYAREEVLNKVAALGPVWMTRQQSGALATQSVEHIEALDGYFARFLPQMRIVLLLPLLIAVVVGWLDYLVAIFLLLSAPLIPLFMALVGMGAERLNKEQLLRCQALGAFRRPRTRHDDVATIWSYACCRRRLVCHRPVSPPEHAHSQAGISLVSGIGLPRWPSPSSPCRGVWSVRLYRLRSFPLADPVQRSGGVATGSGFFQPLRTSRSIITTVLRRWGRRSIVTILDELTCRPGLTPPSNQMHRLNWWMLR